MYSKDISWKLCKNHIGTSTQNWPKYDHYATNSKTILWNRPIFALKALSYERTGSLLLGCHTNWQKYQLTKKVCCCWGRWIGIIYYEIYSSPKIQNPSLCIDNASQDIWACCQVHCLHTVSLCVFYDVSQLRWQLTILVCHFSTNMVTPSFSHCFKLCTNKDIFWKFYKNHIGTSASNLLRYDHYAQDSQIWYQLFLPVKQWREQKSSQNHFWHIDWCLPRCLGTLTSSLPSNQHS